MKLFKHQKETLAFLMQTPRAYVASTAGTGKTLCLIKDVEYRLSKNPKSKTLILAPKSLLYTVWEREFKDWCPNIKVSVATAPTRNRLKKFQEDANVYVTNVDALTWLAEQPKKFWDNFETVIVDESTAIANHKSARGKAAIKVSKNFDYRRCLSGTPTSGLLTKLFNQYLFLDDGQKLGRIATKFRNQVLYAKQIGPMPQHVEWHNKPGKSEVVAYLVKDITIRYELEDVLDMPPLLSYTYTYDMNTKSTKAYKEMENSLRLQIKEGVDAGTEINAVNAAAMTTKLLQIASGSVKVSSDSDEVALIDTQRYDLVLDICEQYEHVLVFFNWQHQRKYFLEQSDKRGLTVTYIDGTVKLDDRTQRVADFQEGKYDIIFCQPQSTSHGITLTSAHATIWASPTYLSDYYSQGNNRVYRAGQTKRTAIINIEANKTLDHNVYKKLNGKLNAMEVLQEALK